MLASMNDHNRSEKSQKAYFPSFRHAGVVLNAAPELCENGSGVAFGQTEMHLQQPVKQYVLLTPLGIPV
jgi:hypothetical protein